MERENGKGILFGVLGIMTLIIAILGASLAYFTATARSAENAVRVESATVAINYVQGQILQATDLIPATQAVAERAYGQSGESQCLDSNNKKVCSVFSFETHNNGEKDLEIVGKILTTTDITGEQTTEFDNLSYIVYETTTGAATPINTTKTTFANFGGSTELFNDGTDNKVTVTSGSHNKYEVLIWLNELATSEQLQDETNMTEGNQDHEQGLTYTGTVEITVSGTSDKITGE